MPLLTENSFENLADELVSLSEELTLSLFARITELTKQEIDQPGSTNLQVEIDKIQVVVAEYIRRAFSWVDQNLSRAYERGIMFANGSVGEIELRQEGGFVGVPLFDVNSGGGRISDVARKVLDKYPTHHTMYTAFQEAAYRAISDSQLVVVRDFEDKVRSLTVLTSDTQYLNSDSFTRRGLSQRLMNSLSDSNISGIRYSDGRTMKLDTYSEMVARTQTGNAARQASVNRLQEYGIDLVQISTHAPCSNLCQPWQGRVYSISGTSDKYLSLGEAISGGLYHVNCKHTQSGYIEGVSQVSRSPVGRIQNSEQYQIEQRLM